MRRNARGEILGDENDTIGSLSVFYIDTHTHRTNSTHVVTGKTREKELKLLITKTLG